MFERNHCNVDVFALGDSPGKVQYLPSKATPMVKVS